MTFLHPLRRLHTRHPCPGYRVWLCGLALAVLGGCATGPDGGSIYVPVGGSGDQDRPVTGQPESAPSGDIGQPKASPPTVEEPPAPTHRTEGQSISPAAAGLVRQADQAFAAGNISGGMGLLQRAQRISPDASAIYYKMAEGYVLEKNLPRAEQFATKGISLAGSNQGLQKSGWRLLSDIRRARGNFAGAQTAEDRASSL